MQFNSFVTHLKEPGIAPVIVNN